MHIGYVLEESSFVFPWTLNNGFNNSPKRLFLIAIISSIKLFKRKAIFCFFDVSLLVSEGIFVVQARPKTKQNRCTETYEYQECDFLDNDNPVTAVKIYSFIHMTF